MNSADWETVKHKRQRTLILLLLLAVSAAALANIALGTVRLSPGEVAAALWGSGSPDHRAIVLDYRLSRTLLGMLVGASLAVAGLIAQTMLRNPLASPGTLGITAGAGLGAVIIAMVLPHAASGMLSGAAFAGGAAVAAAIYLFSYREGVDPLRLALVGVAVGSLCGAGIDLMLIKGSANLSTALVWLTGSLWGRGWRQLMELLPWAAVLLPLSWRLSLHLDVLNLGEELAAGIGVRVQLLRLTLFASVVGLAGASVSTAGTIGFVGLICPHMARRLAGAQHRRALPVAALLGALFVLCADLLGHLARPPLEIPAGLIIALIGGPYFIYLLWRSSRQASG